MAYESLKDRNLTEGFPAILEYLNDVTNTWFSNMLLIGIYIIVMGNIVYFKDDWFEAAAVAGFITFICSVFLWIIEFVAGITMIICAAIALLGFASLWLSRKGR